MESISIDKLDSTIKEMLEEYSNDISDDVKIITHKVIDNFNKLLKKILLEVIENGGRTRANDFIDKNYEIAESELEKLIVEVVQGGH